jgi:hypothetical protein
LNRLREELDGHNRRNERRAVTHEEIFVTRAA